MKLLYGKKIADTILGDLKNKLADVKKKPTLAVVLIGENKASKLYIKLKAKAAKKISVRFILCKFDANAGEKSIIQTIKKLNKDKDVSGIIVQLPLPGKFSTAKIIKTIDPQKDADGFHPINVKNFLNGRKGIEPVFPSAIIGLLKKTDKILKNKKAVVIANSEIFGKIMQEALSRKKIKADYIITSRLKSNINTIKNADIIITAAGVPGLINGSIIKKGVIIIDGGITKKGKKTLGDVDASSVAQIAAFLSPVPGGVGPMTVACLLTNVYRAYRQNK